MFLDMILKLSLRKSLVELFVADWTLVVTLVNVIIDVLLHFQEVLCGELLVTDGTGGHSEGVGGGGRVVLLTKAVRSWNSGVQLRDGGGGGGRVNVFRHQRGR